MSKYRGIAHCFISCFRLIPAGLRKSIFTMLSLAYYYLFSRHRLLAVYNLQVSFPEKHRDEIIQIAKKVYRNLALVGAELFDIPGLTKDNIKDIVEIEGLEHCRQALQKGRGLLIFSAHFGNWELAAAAMSLFLQPMVVVYRTLDSPLLEDIVFLIRSATGNIPLVKERAMRQMLRYLKKNMILGILMDQNMAWEEGVFVDYFSRPACTTDAVAQLALRTQAAVIPSFNFRMPSGKYRIILGKEMPTVDTGNLDADVLVNTQHYTKVIEDMVRQQPDHWLWVHHRWKTKPWQIT